MIRILLLLFSFGVVNFVGTCNYGNLEEIPLHIEFNKIQEALQLCHTVFYIELSVINL